MKQSLQKYQPARRPAIMSVFAGVLTIILVLVPFHGFLTVWGASLLGAEFYTPLRLWKEVLLGLTIIGCVAVYIYQVYHGRRIPLGASHDGTGAETSLRAVLVLSAAYVVLLTAAATAEYVSGGVPLVTAAYGWLLDARPVVFLLVTWWVSLHTDVIVRNWRRILLVPAAIVVVFGLLQFTVLPPDFLQHFGYGTDTIDATPTVDEKAGYQRIQSTLRGANPLGAYLVIVLAACTVLLVAGRRGRQPLEDGEPEADMRRRSAWPKFMALGLAGTVVIGLTYSRSAWLGLGAAAAGAAWLALPAGKPRRWLLLSAAAMLLTGAAAGYVLRDNDVFQNAVFHTDEHSRSAVSSNAGHLSAATQGLADIKRQPFGGGVGTAGPASVHGAGMVRIAENYFVQIGQEVGIFGLILYLALSGTVAYALYARQQHPLARTLLVSFVGIGIINMLSHAWADDTLAYLWWGLAGAALTLPVSKKRIINRKHE